MDTGWELLLFSLPIGAHLWGAPCSLNQRLWLLTAAALDLFFCWFKLVCWWVQVLLETLKRNRNGTCEKKKKKNIMQLITLLINDCTQMKSFVFSCFFPHVSVNFCWLNYNMYKHVHKQQSIFLTHTHTHVLLMKFKVRWCVCVCVLRSQSTRAKLKIYLKPQLL